MAVPNARGGAYLGDYELGEGESQVTVTVADGERTIQSNELPDHPTGAFPNAESPSPIVAHELTVSFPVAAEWTGSKTPASLSGVAINGIKFDPTPVERVECASGESYAIEALGGSFDLGLDFNNAHVQADGEYHYHGLSQFLLEADGAGSTTDTNDDLVLVGFAPDGYLIYYSKSGAYRSGYKLSTTPLTGSDCSRTGPATSPTAIDDLDSTPPNGSFTSDWVWDADRGDLDECNGTEIDGHYAYVVTDAFPFVGRCLNGRFDTARFGAG